MNEFLLILSVVINVVVITGFVWLIIEHKKLRQLLTILSDEVERNNKDIVGLCSAAVSVDNRLVDSRDQLKNIVEKVTGFEHQEYQEHQPHEDGQQSYHDAIQRVKNGADVDELIQKCRLSQDEAVLLIRLHGHANSLNK